MNYTFYIEDSPVSPRQNVYLYKITVDNDVFSAYINVENGGCLEWKKVAIKNPDDKGEPLFSFHKTDKNILMAIADGLSAIGVFPEIDNKERIAAQAIAQERLEAIRYFQALNRDLIYAIKGKIVRE